MDTLCTACGAVFHAKDDTHCDACGAARGTTQGALVAASGEVRAVGSWKDLRRSCGWCGSATPDLARTACAACGGELPSVPPRILAELHLPSPPTAAPAAPPRKLPSGYADRVRYWKNVEVLIGVAFVVIGTPGILLMGFGLIFVGAGVWLYRRGMQRANDQLRALEAGVPVEGTLTAVEVDTSQHINHQHPWRLRYRFEGPAGPVDGEVHSWDAVTEARAPGERIWVVYDPARPPVNSPWPPIR